MSKAKKQKNANKHRALSAQQTIPYIAMHPDGICQIPGGIYTKTLEYEDINYAVASTEDQTAIIRDRKSTRLNSSHRSLSRMPSSA